MDEEIAKNILEAARVATPGSPEFNAYITAYADFCYTSAVGLAAVAGLCLIACAVSTWVCVLAMKSEAINDFSSVHAGRVFLGGIFALLSGICFILLSGYSIHKFVLSSSPIGSII